MAESAGSSYAYNSANTQQWKSFKNGSYGPTFFVGRPSPAVASPITASTSSSSVTWPLNANANEVKPASASVAVNGSNGTGSTSRSVLPEEETRIITETSAKISASLAGDQLVTLFPEVDEPFVDAEDIVRRLLPYHVYQQPKEDLEYVAKAAKWRKGKGKVTEVSALREEIAETRFAIQCFKRRKALEDRFRRTKIKSGKRKAPDDLAYLSAQAMLEQERTENALLNHELRHSRSELEKIQRERRLQSLPPRTSYYPSQTQTSSQTTPYIHQYRPYPYTYTPTYAQPYTQQYGTPPPASIPAPVYSPAPPAPASAAPAQSADTPTSNTSSSGPVPVQLPVSSLPDLQRIGIFPVPAHSVVAGQPSPAAILKNYGGGMVHLDVNVGLLQPAQMSGLAMLLNTLMTRGQSAQAASSPATLAEGAAPVLATAADGGGPSGQ
ncbi:hypothetical protein NEOLEDRAFT_1128450 [Neolentinus lepideus HHB14362 ss-1]|uniref:GLTSCR protein conserved domain-containing protein n=1 Tax=Neolentinus lepideus HHB14362 ss-1 TaxID=1314782 RepID=A0A165V0C2_9AGAM|nr:hypothetical protein NEOLEDRAFT_1128450 [Neolentinus lepideus HHB14362 ss-1]